MAGLDAGADEYLTKPVDQAALVARVRSVLRIKSLHEKVQEQAADLADWNLTLAQRVKEQVTEIERIGRLKRFLAPQVAQLVSSGDERLLESHRREVTIVFCDLRNFTPFSETAQPEEVIAVLREYHGAIGVLIDKFEGTMERFAGDGLLVLFNDPLPCADPSAKAVQWPSKCAMRSLNWPGGGVRKDMNSVLVSELHTVMRHWDASDLRAGFNTQSQVRFRTSPLAYATRRPTAKSL